VVDRGRGITFRATGRFTAFPAPPCHYSNDPNGSTVDDAVVSNPSSELARAMTIAVISTMGGELWGGSEELWAATVREVGHAPDEVLVSAPAERMAADQIASLTAPAHPRDRDFPPECRVDQPADDLRRGRPVHRPVAPPRRPIRAVGCCLPGEPGPPHEGRCGDCRQALMFLRGTAKVLWTRS
jgi:hypothetical protein